MNKLTFQKDISVIVADDHPMFRTGLSTTLRTFSFVKEVHEASDGSELLNRLKIHDYDIVFLDVIMPLIDGEAAAHIIHEKHQEARIIVMSMIDDMHLIRRLYAAGCHGYLVKNADSKEIKEAMNAVLSGEKYFDHILSGKIASELLDTNNRGHHKLTVSEIKLIPLLCAEKSNKEIAQELHLSTRTVEKHRYNIYNKVGVKNIRGLIQFALSHKII